MFRLTQLLIWLTQGGNVLLGGYADESMSSRAYRMKLKGHKYWGWTADAIDKLFFWQTDHCRNAWLQELDRRQLPPELRGQSQNQASWDDEWQS